MLVNILLYENLHRGLDLLLGQPVRAGENMFMWLSLLGLGLVMSSWLERKIRILRIRHCAARADPKALELLIRALKNRNSDGRRCAAEGLGRIADPRAVDPLIVALEDVDPAVREAAAQALGEIHSSRAVEPLSKVLSDGRSAVRKHALSALGKIGDVKAVERLIEVVADMDEDLDVRETAADALAEVGDISTIRCALRKTLCDRRPSVRREAAHALGQLGDVKDVERLIEALRDTDEDAGVRETAAHALGKIGGKSAIPALQEVWREASTSDLPLRRAARLAVHRIDSQKSPGALGKVDWLPWLHDMYVPKTYRREKEDKNNDDQDES